MSDQYHLGELKVALDPTHPKHILPPPRPLIDTVLDIGCGAGQTLIAAYGDRVTFGLDVDHDALKLGRTLTSDVRFVCGSAEALPFPDRKFNLVAARVSLAYSNIPASLREIRRVLRPGGTLWMTLHPFSIPWSSAKVGNIKGKIFFAYICLNSLLFHLFQRQFSLMGKCESFQTEHGIRRALERAGFADMCIERGVHFVVTATAR